MRYVARPRAPRTALRRAVRRHPAVPDRPRRACQPRRDAGGERRLVPGLRRLGLSGLVHRQAGSGRPQVLRAILGSLGQDAERCLAEADSAIVRDAYAAQTSRARDLGLFGSPTFVCGTELFWGDDRLDVHWRGRCGSVPPIDEAVAAVIDAPRGHSGLRFHCDLRSRHAQVAGVELLRAHRAAVVLSL
ncbi:MAG: DsbA family protein [Rubrivivax sp.]